MKEIYIGDIVNTHGIKGELRIISDFKYKDKVFKIGMKVYVGKRREELKITSYRVHKIYDMVTFEGINDINDAIVYKGDSLYVNRDDIEIDGYLSEDIIGLDVYNSDKLIGKVEAIINNNAHEIIIVNSNNGKQMIPFIDEFIDNVDLENKIINIKVIDGLLNED